MLKMLIVEDERWEREGLLDYTDWSSLGIEVVDTACDGLEGLEKVRRHLPDIVITDIKMPALDGIDMSKKIKSCFPQIKIILLTGYDDFQYAREAVGFSANGYLLKPVEEEEFLAVIQKTVEECHREKLRELREESLKVKIKENNDIIMEKFLLDLLEGRIEGKKIYKTSSGLGIAQRAASYRVAGCVSGNGEREKGDWIESTMEYLSPYIPEPSMKTRLNLSDGAGLSFEAVIFSLHNVPIQADEDTSRFKTSRPGGKYIVGLGAAVGDLAHIPESFLQAKACLEYGVFWSKYGIHHYGKIDREGREFKRNTGEFLTRGNYFTKQILLNARAMDHDRTYALLEEMFTFLKGNPGVTKEMVGHYLFDLVNETSLLLYRHLSERGYEGGADCANQILNMDTFEDMRDHVSTFFQYVLVPAEDQKDNKNEYIIHKVIRLVKENYMRDISLKAMAEEVFLSPNYLGCLFKKRMDKSFCDFLNEYRMEKAKELLHSPKNKVNCVARKVGIANTSYFCVVFKNICGMTPGEYQEMVIRG